MPLRHGNHFQYNYTQIRIFIYGFYHHHLDLREIILRSMYILFSIHKINFRDFKAVSV